MRTLATLLIAGAVAAIVYRVQPPAAATPMDLRAPASSDAVERGRYLYNLAGCDTCHTRRDFTRFGSPSLSQMPGSGGETAPNLTPDPATGLGAWTDAEIVRAIREGVGREGQVLSRAMPSAVYGAMSDTDVLALTAYLRALSPVRNRVPRCPVETAGAALKGSKVLPVARVPEPNRGDPVRYGRYLATIGRCLDCHSQTDRGLAAGGRIFRMPGAAVASANLTPHPRAGIGRWSERDFLDRFAQYRGYAERGAPAVGPGGFTVMPWLNFCRVEPSDLAAIYSFLRTLPPSPAAIDIHPVTDKAILMSLKRNF